MAETPIPYPKNNDVVEIDLLELFHVLWNKALLIITIGLFFAAAAFGITYFFITPKYEATATFYASSSTFDISNASLSITNGELSTSETLVKTYVAILNSRTTLNEIMADAGVGYSLKDFRDMISTKSIAGTGLFDVTVSDEDPMEAEKIANTIAKVLPDRITDIIEGSGLKIVDYAIVPARRASPSYAKNTAIGALAGCFLAAAIILVKYFIVSSQDVTIHSSDDLKALYPDIPILAVIPDMRKNSTKGTYYYSDYYRQDDSSGKKKKSSDVGEAI